MGQDDEIKLDPAVDLWAMIWFVMLKRDFSPVGAFVDLDIDDRSPEAIDLWVDAPWFLWNAVVADNVCNRYIDTGDWLR